jgi:hypothetical protein
MIDQSPSTSVGKSKKKDYQSGIEGGKIRKKPELRADGQEEEQ